MGLTPREKKHVRQVASKCGLRIRFQGETVILISDEDGSRRTMPLSDIVVLLGTKNPTKKD